MHFTGAIDPPGEIQGSIRRAAIALLVVRAYQLQTDWSIQYAVMATAGASDLQVMVATFPTREEADTYVRDDPAGLLA
jgi:hypothetical protein